MGALKYFSNYQTSKVLGTLFESNLRVKTLEVFGTFY